MPDELNEDLVGLELGEDPNETEEVEESQPAAAPQWTEADEAAAAQRYMERTGTVAIPRNQVAQPAQAAAPVNQGPYIPPLPDPELAYSDLAAYTAQTAAHHAAVQDAKWEQRFEKMQSVMQPAVARNFTSSVVEDMMDSGLSEELRPYASKIARQYGPQIMENYNKDTVEFLTTVAKGAAYDDMMKRGAQSAPVSMPFGGERVGSSVNVRPAPGIDRAELEEFVQGFTKLNDRAPTKADMRRFGMIQ